MNTWRRSQCDETMGAGGEDYIRPPPHLRPCSCHCANPALQTRQGKTHPIAPYNDDDAPAVGCDPTARHTFGG
eukprot:5095886-Pyramimonas_sp.AAC.5